MPKLQQGKDGYARAVGHGEAGYCHTPLGRHYLADCILPVLFLPLSLVVTRPYAVTPAAAILTISSMSGWSPGTRSLH